ncbi:MAG: hypothetical protein AAF590_04230 [Pseudomonadota bacterium]
MSTSANTLSALVDILLRHHLTTLETVWDLTLPDVRRAIRLISPPSTTAPTASDLEALMRTFPDRQPHTANYFGGPMNDEPN